MSYLALLIRKILLRECGSRSRAEHYSHFEDDCTSDAVRVDDRWWYCDVKFLRSGRQLR